MKRNLKKAINIYKGENMANEEDYKLSSDVGKLRLSARDIYDYNGQEKNIIILIQ